MKNLILFGCFILMLVFVQFAQAQTVDEIITRHLEAMGGKEKLSSLQTVKMEGTMSTQGVDVTLTSTKSHMKGMRMDLDVMATSNYIIVTAKQGVIFLPISGMTSPQDMPAEQHAAIVDQLDIQGALLNAKEKGTQVVYEGKEGTGTTALNKLKLTFANGTVMYYFLDAQTNRIAKIDSKRTENGQVMDVSTSFANYKQNASGYWFPYSVTTLQGTTDYHTITTNLAVDEQVFKN